MRSLLRWLPLALLFLAHPSIAEAQEGGTTLLAGYGGIDHQASLGPAVHLNLRQRLVRWDSIPFGAPRPRRAYLPRFEVQAEAFAQRGRSGTRLDACRAPGGQLCTRSADPVYLLGAGLVSRATVTAVHRPLQLYFLPLTAAVYLHGYQVREAPIGSMTATSESGLRVAGGLGNGLGVQLDVRDVSLLLEVRAVLIRDVDGTRAGSLPISLGLSW